MAVGTSVACQTREHQAKAVQEFCSGAEGTADARHSGTLVQRQRSRHIENIVHRRFCCLGHTPAGIGRQGVQIPAGAFCIQDAQRQGGFS